MKIKYVIAFIGLAFLIFICFLFLNKNSSNSEIKPQAVIHSHGITYSDDTLNSDADSDSDSDLDSDSIPETIVYEEVEDYPQINIKGQFVRHRFYSLLYSENHEQPYWVRYVITKENIENSIVERKDNFRMDPSVVSISASLADYRKSGYDRGHLCPAGDMKFSKLAMSESFYMSNMSPQHPSLNRGRWKQLESMVRKWALKYDSTIIYCGGVLDSVNEYIGENKVAVPKYFYKVVYCPNTNLSAVAFVMPNRKCEKNIQDYIVSVDSVEILTHIDFFAEYSKELQHNIESRVNSYGWF